MKAKGNSPLSSTPGGVGLDYEMAQDHLWQHARRLDCALCALTDGDWWHWFEVNPEKGLRSVRIEGLPGLRN